MCGRARKSLAALIFLGLGGCCCDEDDCHWALECYLDGCCTYCYYVLYCHYGLEARAGPRLLDDGEGLDFEATAESRGDGTIDLLIEVRGDRVDGRTPLSVRLVGPNIQTPRRQSRSVLWTFYGIPEGAVDRVEVGLPGTSTRMVRPVDAVAGHASPCDPRERRLETAMLAGALRGASVGGEVSIRAPSASEVLRSGDYQGMALEVLAPGTEGPEVHVLKKGESARVALDRRGSWRFRLTILLEDACGVGSVDAIVIEDVETTVS